LSSLGFNVGIKELLGITISGLPVGIIRLRIGLGIFAAAGLLDEEDGGERGTFTKVLMFGLGILLYYVSIN
jgi:hypothetical protein